MPRLKDFYKKFTWRDIKCDRDLEKPSFVNEKLQNGHVFYMDGVVFEHNKVQILT